MKKFVCTTEGCDCPHCKRCGRHYEPCCETAARGQCDSCIIGNASDEMETLTDAFDGNYEEAIKAMGW